VMAPHSTFVRAWILAHGVSAFYLPGLAPIEYQQGDAVELKVNKLTSAKTQLPYSYYHLAYCTPDGGARPAVTENLGEQMMGDIIETSAYKIKMLEVKPCELLCKKTLTTAEKEKFRNMIADEYLVNWMVDNLPAATKYRQAGSNDRFTNGISVGVPQEGKYYLYNHATLDLLYHENNESYVGYRIVGFEVEPRSAVPLKDGSPDCQSATPTPFDLDSSNDVLFSYTVKWTRSDVRWASRWDAYLKVSGQGQIHWFAILNSLLILVFLSGMVAMILLRTLHRDIATYNQVPTEEEAKEETGWKLVHGDVFRKPNHSTLLSVLAGSGMQLLGMSVV
ncbi:Transmembrane 9 superfamily member 7 (Endomembrane protein 5) (Transmembrane nine protein 7) (AtTMN7), partial [Durusdinium trenchii]